MRRLFRMIEAGSALVAVLALAPTAKAEQEFRLKLDMDYNVLDSAGSVFTLRPMLRTEQRFRKQGLVLLKVFAGMRSDLLSWLMIQTYYAHKEKFLKKHEEVDMYVFDVIFHQSFGAFKIADRNGNEWHSSPGFYRYRNNLSIRLKPGLDWLMLFVSDEVRFDSDQSRMNMNDLLAGIEIIPGRRIHFLIYYDLESNRRSKSYWENTDVVQLMLVVRLGAHGTQETHGHE